MSSTEPRLTAVKLLDKTFRSGSYSNIQLGNTLSRSDMEQRDKAFCSALYYGVIERRITLDHIISGLSSRPLNKLDSIILNILRCGLYQILYMESIPDSAAVNESVLLAKKAGKTSASGMVNAILRNFLRRDKKFDLPGKPGSIGRLSVEYSAPEEMVRELMENNALSLLDPDIRKDTVYIRRNPLRCTSDLLCDTLGGVVGKENINSMEDILPGCFAVKGGGDIIRTKAFEAGYFHVQSFESQFCCKAVSPESGDIVYDMCAAPGGKTFTMAEYSPGGEIWSSDLHEKRVKLIKDGAGRLGLENIKASPRDASKFDESLPQFSKILCDVPCSGLGVIRSKPEIKYKSISDFAGLPQIQYDIAHNAVRYLRPGGILVYSTCTVRKAENGDVCDRLLSECPELEPVTLPELPGVGPCSRMDFLPEMYGNGFFVAKFRKVR